MFFKFMFPFFIVMFFYFVYSLFFKINNNVGDWYYLALSVLGVVVSLMMTTKKVKK